MLHLGSLTLVTGHQVLSDSIHLRIQDLVRGPLKGLV